MESLQDITLTALLEKLEIREAERDKFRSFEAVHTIERYLATKTETENKKDASTRNAATTIRRWLAVTILPGEIFAERSPYAVEEKRKVCDDEVAEYHAISHKAIVILSHLEILSPLSEDEDLVSTYAFLTSFTNPGDPWTCELAMEAASALLEKLSLRWDRNKQSILLNGLLRTKIKPAFAKSKNPAITPQARKAIDPLPVDSLAHSDLDVEAKPWKYRDVCVVTILRWVLDNLGQAHESFIEANWPLIIPPLLALIDDTNTKHKARGCLLLSVFLRTVPAALVERTGLGEVFENAIMPCLMYLPTLTDEVDSLILLRAAYPALIALGHVRFPDDKHKPSRLKMLDRVLRFGVLKGYTHAGDYVKIAELLVSQTIALVNEMGIYFVKHLQDILRLLSANLAAPFATAYPPLLHVSVLAIQTIILTAWPRVAYNRGEILKGLTICWCRIEEQEATSTELYEVKEDIKRTIPLLTMVLEKEVNVVDEYQSLIDSDGKLEELLVV